MKKVRIAACNTLPDNLEESRVIVPLKVEDLKQEPGWKNLGIYLSRATMANWVIVASRDWLMPIVNLLHEKLIEENTFMLMKPEFR